MGEKMQAAGQDGKQGDATGSGKVGAGESGGGAYPNPHTGKDGGKQDSPLGTGGQTDNNYFGGDVIDGKKQD